MKEGKQWKRRKLVPIYLHHEPEVLVDLSQKQDPGEEERGGDREEQLRQEKRLLLPSWVSRWLWLGRHELASGRQEEGRLGVETIDKMEERTDDEATDERLVQKSDNE